MFTHISHVLQLLHSFLYPLRISLKLNFLDSQLTIKSIINFVLCLFHYLTSSVSDDTKTVSEDNDTKGEAEANSSSGQNVEVKEMPTKKRLRQRKVMLEKEGIYL